MKLDFFFADARVVRSGERKDPRAHGSDLREHNTFPTRRMQVRRKNDFKRSPGNWTQSVKPLETTCLGEHFRHLENLFATSVTGDPI